MSLVVATEAAKVRRMCGSPDTTDISDTNLQAFFTEDALDWMNDRRPKTAIRSFNTVQNQQVYDVKPASARRIVNVWWLDAGWNIFSPTMKTLPDALNLDQQLTGFSVLDNPALVTEFYKKVVEYERNFKGVGEETDNGKIRLLPAPTTTGDPVYFSYSFDRWSSITNIPREYVEAVRYFVAGMVMQYFFIKRGQITSGRNWSGGGGRNEEVMANSFMLRAHALVPTTPTIARI